MIAVDEVLEDAWFNLHQSEEDQAKESRRYREKRVVAVE